MSVPVRSWRRGLVLASAAALVLASAASAAAQEPVDPDRGVSCDAELLDDEEGFPFYAVEPGQTLECTAVGLDPQVDAEWSVDVFAFDDDELFEGGDDEFDEPTASFGSDGPQTPTEDGQLTFSFTLPDDIVVGFFDGIVTQGDGEEPTYEEFFGGFISGFVEGDMTCEPDPAARGEEVACAAELNPGEFEWEVYEISVRDLVELLFGDGDVEPDSSGSGQADDGTGEFAFTLAADGNAEAYFAVAFQDDAVAFYIGEIVPADDTSGGGDDDGPQPIEESDDAVSVPRPTRVDAGAGGAATAGGSVALLGALLAPAALVLSRHRPREA